MPVTDRHSRTRALPSGTWSIDPANSQVGFAIKHMALKTLHGCFQDFEGTIVLSGGAPGASGSVRAASIDTGDPIRDGHLCDSSDFFDVEHHPEIEFRSTSILPAGPGRLRVEGELSMRGQTRELVLEGELNQGSPGERRIGLRLRGELNRKHFGLTWNQALDAGGALLGNKVKVDLTLSAVA
jgi:polyisoprenoid-binding protein YceI